MRWLLTFSALSPVVTLEQVCVVGGVRLAECYIAQGQQHSFVMLVTNETGMGELDAVENFMSRIRSEAGIFPSICPGFRPIHAAGDMHAHPGFRLMAEYRRRGDCRLAVWACADVIANRTHVLPPYRRVQPAIEIKQMSVMLDVLDMTRNELLRARGCALLLGCRAPVVVDAVTHHQVVDATQEALRQDVGATRGMLHQVVNATQGHHQAGCRRRDEQLKRRRDEPPHGETVSKRPLPYQYVRRDNDDKWTMGWA